MAYARKEEGPGEDREGGWSKGGGGVKSSVTSEGRTFSTRRRE